MGGVGRPADEEGASRLALISMGAYFRDVLRHHELLYVFVWRDIKIKYKQSVMGFLWALFMPMLIVLAGIFVRVAFAQVSGGGIEREHVASVAVKAVAWAFVASTLRMGTASLIGNPALVTKIKFPKVIFPLASAFSALFDMAIASVVVVATVLILGVHPTWSALWVLPLLATLFLLLVGVTSTLAVANLFFRDVKYIVEVVVTFAIFFTPVFYDAASMGAWRPVVLLNPVAPILEGLRDAAVLGVTPPLGWLAYAFGAAVLLDGVALLSFARLEPRFAENI